MKTVTLTTAILSALSWLPLAANTYTNFIRQVQMPSGVQWDASVAPSGEQSSSLPVDIGGARFELWTVRSAPLTSYLLDSRHVSAYAPSAEVVICSADPYPLMPRTRADQPFTVEITLSGLLDQPAAPEAARAATLLRHVQSYGAGNGGEIDRTQATLLTSSRLASNGAHRLSYAITSVPSANLAKTRGEERFSVFSLPDGAVPAGQLASRHIQIWPVADGSIHGISPGEKIRLMLPRLTITLNDLYPESRTYAQVYRGTLRDGEQGTIVPGTALVLNGSVPENRVLLLDRYDEAFDGDGIWTMELLTETPFGTDRLAHVTFEIDRTIEVNGSMATME